MTSPSLRDVLALLAVHAPAEPERAAEVDEHLRGEVQVEVVGDAVRHPRGTEVEAVRLGQVDELVGVLRDAGPMNA